MNIWSSLGLPNNSNLLTLMNTMSNQDNRQLHTQNWRPSLQYVERHYYKPLLFLLIIR
jgi:hypothetical protein